MSVQEMMAELDEIARQRNIVWGPAEMPGTNKTPRTNGNGYSNYAKGGKTVDMATEKQIAFIRKLQMERGEDILTDEQAATVTKKSASENITRLMAMPKIQNLLQEKPKTVDAELSPGMYKFEGEIYKVQQSRESGRLYAKHLEVPSMVFQYAPGIIFKLSQACRMTLEEAKEFGAMYGTCCVCGRTLTNEASIEAGIGPICGGRL